MPIKWTAERDHLLLLKLLETHDLKVDTSKIVEAWPDNAGDKPTPRAVTERIVKIRADAKKNGLISGTTPAKIALTSTPRKNNGGTQQATPKSTPKSTAKKSVKEEDSPLKQKRKRVDAEDGEVNEVEPIIKPDPNADDADVKPIIKPEPVDLEVDMHGLPLVAQSGSDSAPAAKRARRAPTPATLGRYVEPDMDDDDEGVVH